MKFRHFLNTWPQLVLLLLALGNLVTPYNSHAQEDSVSEYKLKAGILYKFLFPQYISWPTSFEEEEGPIDVCVVGDDREGAISAMRKIKAHNKSISVTVSEYTSGLDLEECKILFISKSKEDSLDEIISRIDGLPILTVSELDDFVLRGGMLSILIVDSKPWIEINTAAAAQAKIRFKSDLIGLAKRVIR